MYSLRAYAESRRIVGNTSATRIFRYSASRLARVAASIDAGKFVIGFHSELFVMSSGASASSWLSVRSAMTRGVVIPAAAHHACDIIDERNVALQAPEPGAIIRLVAHRLAVHHLHEAKRKAAVQVNECGVLIDRHREPVERGARAPRQQLVRQLFARPELRLRDALQLPQHPALERSLPLEVLVRQRELHTVLPRPGAAAEDLAHGEEIEGALGLLRRQPLQTLRRRLRAAQRRYDERKEHEDSFQAASRMRSVRHDVRHQGPT